MRDALVLVLLVLGFASLVTVHVVIAATLTFRHRPRYRGLAALIVPPLAPYWIYEAGRPGLCALWVSSLLVYLGALILGA